ncbi:MAG: hypothetical protein EYC62_08655 [Alphaproteobacteria bacterium]|nr:MAG: hypothetical protein EYC62_08655 [Alphaproteobacteria bacterium]
MKLPKNRILRWSAVILSGGIVSALAFTGIHVGTAGYRNEVTEVTKVFQPATDNLHSMADSIRISGDSGFGYTLAQPIYGSSDWNGKMGGIVGALSKPANEIYNWPKLTSTEISDALVYIKDNVHENARRKFPIQAGLQRQRVILSFIPGFLIGLALKGVLLPGKIR